MLEVEWPRSGSIEGERGAELNTRLYERLRAIAALNADARLHRVGSDSELESRGGVGGA